MAITFFWALARLPMAEAIALAFVAPLMTLYGGDLLGRDRPAVDLLLPGRLKQSVISDARSLRPHDGLALHRDGLHRQRGRPVSRRRTDRQTQTSTAMPTPILDQQSIKQRGAGRLIARISCSNRMNRNQSVADYGIVAISPNVIRIVSRRQVPGPLAMTVEIKPCARRQRFQRSRVRHDQRQFSGG